jgi:hypothetical protein
LSFWILSIVQYLEHNVSEGGSVSVFRCEAADIYSTKSNVTTVHAFYDDNGIISSTVFLTLLFLMRSSGSASQHCNPSAPQTVSFYSSFRYNFCVMSARPEKGNEKSQPGQPNVQIQIFWGMKRKCCVIGDDGNDDSGAA